MPASPVAAYGQKSSSPGISRLFKNNQSSKENLNSKQFISSDSSPVKYAKKAGIKSNEILDIRIKEKSGKKSVMKKSIDKKSLTFNKEDSKESIDEKSDNKINI